MAQGNWDPPKTESRPLPPKTESSEFETESCKLRTPVWDPYCQDAAPICRLERAYVQIEGSLQNNSQPVNPGSDSAALEEEDDVLRTWQDADDGDIGDGEVEEESDLDN